MASPIAGSWRVFEMDVWDREAIDLVGPGFIKFNADGTGDFRFIAVDGYLDCRSAERAGPPRVDFTWEGNDDGDRASGRGWAELETDGSLRGHIFFHAGNDSGFRAIREEGPPDRSLDETHRQGLPPTVDPDGRPPVSQHAGSGSSPVAEPLRHQRRRRGSR